MKSFIFKKILNGLMCLVTLFGLFCFMSCAADAGSDSDDNNTDKLVLDFNGGKMHGHKTVEFSMDDITPHVGKAIDEAFKCLGLDTAFIKKEGFYLHGWTLKKDAETCVTNLPTFGTLYAKWGTDPLEDDNENVPLTLTLNFNGGKLNNNESITFQDEELNDFKGRPISEFLRTIGFLNPEKANFIFAGWTKIKDGNDFITNIPTSGTVTYYARWTENKKGTITLKAREGDTFYNMQGNSTTLELSFEFESGITLEDLLKNKGYDYSTMVHKYEYKQTEYNFICFEDKNGIEYRKDKILTETVELSPKFESSIRPLNVVFNLNGGKLNKQGELSFENELLDHYRESSISDFLKKLYSSIPEKENFIFAGWTTIKDGNEVVSNFPSYGSYIYYAKWETPENGIITLKAKEGDIFYNSKGEFTESELSFEFESGITLEDLLKNKGYDYSTMVKGYPGGGREYIFNCFEDTNGIEYNRDKVLNGTVTIKPKFKSIPQVTFDLNGGYILAEDGETELTKSIVKNIPFEDYFDSSLKIDFKPTKKGYTFAGWTLSKNGNDKINSATEDITVYAMWKDALRLFDDGDIVGDFTVDETGNFEDGHSLVYKGNGVYSYEFTYSLNMNSWGSEPGTIQFKFRPTARDWSVAFGFDGEYPTINGEKVKIAPAFGDTNLRASGLVAGYSYVITIECTEDGKYFVNIITNNLKPHAIVVMDLNGASCNGREMMTYPISTEITFEQITSVMDIMFEPGKVLEGWTYTKDGEDFVDEKQTFSEGTTTVFIKWESDTPINPSEPGYPNPIEKLTFTYDAGKGWFHDYKKDELLKTISVEFDPGATLSEISELLMNEHMDHINPMYFFKKDNIEYSYEENGNYYYLTEIKNSDGEVFCNYITNYINQDAYTTKFYDDITFYYSYAKMTNITFKLNGGYIEQYDHETDEENIVTTDIFGFGLEGYKAFSVNNPERDGYVFMGWTLTKDGNDFVTVVPSEDTTLYAKWELPKECVLTINAGEYSQLFDRDGNSLGREVNLTFNSGMTLEGVLSNNNIDFDCMVNEFEIPDTTFEGLKDSEGNEYSYNIANHISDKKLVDSITLYPFYQRIEISGNVGILKYYDYVNDYGNYDEKAEPKYEKKYDKDIFEECLNTPHADGYIFAGWTYTPNGNDYVNLGDYIPAGVTTTVYAKWIPESEVKPLYEYNSDNSQITFTFVPSYFGYDWDSDEFHEVQLLSDATTWDPDERYFMTKDEDGIYTITFDYVNSVYLGFKNWPGFKFLVIEEDIMLGPNEYKISLSNDKIIGPEDSPHFKMEFISSLLTLDLNGGSVNGKTDDILLDSDDIYNRLLVDCFENPIKDGYVFAGWTSTRDEEDYVTYVPAGIDVLYAKWVEPTSGVVTLIARENEVFYDYKGQPLENELSFDFEAGITLGDLLNQYNIDYSNMVYSYENNNEAFVFAEFVDGNGNQYDSTKILTASVTLSPTYNSRAIVNFDLNGGYIDNSQGVRVEGTWTNYVPYGIWFDQWVDGIPQKEGYNFVGWSTSGYADELVTQVTSSCSVCAIWQDPLELFINGDIVGTLTIDETGKFEDGHSLKYEGEGVYTYAFTFDSKNMVGWDAPSNGIAFKLRPVKESWAISYGIIYQGEHPVIGGGEVVTTAVGGAPNIIVGGLKDGNSYIITVRCTEDGDVFVKIDEA